MRNFAIIKLLFEYLFGGDPEIRRIFLAWVTDKSVVEIRPEGAVA